VRVIGSVAGPVAVAVAVTSAEPVPVAVTEPDSDPVAVSDPDPGPDHFRCPAERIRGGQVPDHRAGVHAAQSDLVPVSFTGLTGRPARGVAPVAGAVGLDQGMSHRSLSPARVRF